MRFRPVNRSLALLAAGAAAALVTSHAGAQLTLRDAFHRADQAAYDNRIAAGAAGAGRAQTLAPLKGILPNVRLEAGYVRTTDPIGVFGSTLRQRVVTQANFEPQRLNYPSATGNYQGGVVVEQPLFNADAWIGRTAAAHAYDASRATEEWTRLSTRVDVVRAYYGAILASERVTTLQAAAAAAHAHVAQAEAMVRQGIVTKSDALLASVRAGEVDAQLAEAEGSAATAGRQLAVLLGGDGASQSPDLAARRLPSTNRIVAEVSNDTSSLAPRPRADVSAASDGLAAARDDANRARSTLLPRINGFARYDWNSPARIYTGDRNWTVGVMASWSLFAGANEMADMKATAARAAAAGAQAEAATANARLEAEQTRTALAVALKRLDIAERAVTQSAEAHRIVGRKYEGGLATVVELLDAQAVETQSALSLSQARWSAIAAAAERRRALGLDPATLAALDDTATVAAHASLDGR
ncbi:MAG TPA: TolC family protein [Gemmatimonadaceae bacterium]|nr:TolC family protein [Gemmatimonadaceae bacterium]